MNNVGMVITSETKIRISPENYEKQKGTKLENMICGLIVNLCISEDPMTPKQYLGVYVWILNLVYKGLSIDYALYPEMKGTLLSKEAGSLRNIDLGLLKKEPCINIANLISENDKKFESILISELKIPSNSKIFTSK